ncbi:MAG: SH3 domain-containing protein [Chloroflexaceae bacterium]|nr:SH3 domain-containing protein [Chloroflexaceae bacterium]
MQSLIILLLVVAVIAVGGYLIYRRQMAQNNMMDLPPPEIGELVDYTADAPDEPGSWRERFQQLSLPGKIVIGLLPLLGVLLCIIIGINLVPSPTDTPPPVAEPNPQIAIEKADLVNATTINVIASTRDIPEGTAIEFELLGNGEPFLWYDPTTGVAEVANDRIEMNVQRVPNGPLGEDGINYTVLLTTTIDTEAVTQTQELFIPGTLRGEFIDLPEPTATPTPRPSPTPEVSLTPEVTETPAPEAPTEPTFVEVLVGNGGNVRAAPAIDAEVLGQITLGQTVRVLQKNADATWFQVQLEDGVTGWTSATALLPPPDVVAQIPTEGETTTAEQPASPDAPPPPDATTAPPSGDGVVVTVGNGGNVRATPDVTAPVVGQIMLNEQVQVLAKNADGTWFQVRLPNDTIGWTSFSALLPSAEVVQQLPVA